jgi:hypothetical protein
MFIAQQVPVFSIVSGIRDRLPTLRYSESRQQRFIALSIIQGMLNFERSWPLDYVATFDLLRRQLMAYPSPEGRRYLNNAVVILARSIFRRRRHIGGAARCSAWVHWNCPWELAPSVEEQEEPAAVEEEEQQQRQQERHMNAACEDPDVGVRPRNNIIPRTLSPGSDEYIILLASPQVQDKILIYFIHKIELKAPATP